MADDYRFIEKAPIIDVLRTGIHDDGRGIEEIAAATHGGVTAQTVRKWLFGQTKRPQYYKIAAVEEVLGLEIKHIYSKTGRELVINPSLAEYYVNIHRENVAKRIARMKAKQQRVERVIVDVTNGTPAAKPPKRGKLSLKKEPSVKDWPAFKKMEVKTDE